MDNRPIGVFDSGVGGLTVAKEIAKLLPNEEIVYFGDSGRAPYGPRTTEQITEFTKQICDFLLTKDVKALVIACNTICVSCADVLRADYNVPVFDVIDPGVEAILAVAKKSVGIFATQATVNSGAHKAKIQQKNPALEVYAQPCALFVPLIEEGFSTTPVAYYAAAEYLKAFDGKNVDTLILGCTHYPIIKDSVQKAAGDGVTVVDPSYGTAMNLKEHLEKNDGLRAEGVAPAHQFYTSGAQDKFDFLIDLVFGKGYNSQLHKLG